MSPSEKDSGSPPSEEDSGLSQGAILAIVIAVVVVVVVVAVLVLLRWGVPSFFKIVEEVDEMLQQDQTEKRLHSIP